MEVASLKQGDLSVTKFFTKLKIVWDELESFRPNPICVCTTKCLCSVFSIINKRKCEDQAMQFLHGLNDRYHNIRSHVLLMELIPPMTKIFFSLVAQKERQLASNFLITNVNNVNSNRIIHVIFSFCGKNGHTENTCFCKIGFPNQENKVYKFGSNSNKKLCTNYNRTGHTVDTCYKKHGYPLGISFIKPVLLMLWCLMMFFLACQERMGKWWFSPHYAVVSDHVWHSQAKCYWSHCQPSTRESSGILHCEFQHKVVEQSPTGNVYTLNNLQNAKNYWLIYLGATDHVCMSLSEFTFYKSFKPIQIILPIGHHVFSIFSGTIVFNSKLHLTDVLYVPQFSFNSISASKLNLTLNCSLIFSSTHCLIQDNQTK